jgi:hypothetical protein
VKLPQVIRMVGTYRAEVENPDYPGVVIEIYFWPIVLEHDLVRRHRQFCLLHFQARPRGLRRVGVYESARALYVSMWPQQLHTPVAGYPAGVSEAGWPIPLMPIFVMVYPECRLMLDDGCYRIAT